MVRSPACTRSPSWEVRPWVWNQAIFLQGLGLQYFISSVGFPGGSDGKVSACNAGDPGSIPGGGRSPGEGNGTPLQYSCLENPMDGGAWKAAVHGVAQSRTWLKWPSSSSSSMTQRMKCKCSGLVVKVLPSLLFMFCLASLSVTPQEGSPFQPLYTHCGQMKKSNTDSAYVFQGKPIAKKS